jgi:hypothetical protein
MWGSQFGMHRQMPTIKNIMYGSQVCKHFHIQFYPQTDFTHIYKLVLPLPWRGC